MSKQTHTVVIYCNSPSSLVKGELDFSIQVVSEEFWDSWTSKDETNVFIQRMTIEVGTALRTRLNDAALTGLRKDRDELISTTQKKLSTIDEKIAQFLALPAGDSSDA